MPAFLVSDKCVASTRPMKVRQEARPPQLGRGRNGERYTKAPFDLEDGAARRLGRRSRSMPLRHNQRVQRALRFLQLARDRLPATSRHSVTLDEAKLAADILVHNGVRFLHFTGGEPLVHREFTAMVAHAAQVGMVPTLVTNDAAAGRPFGGCGPRNSLYFDRRRLADGARFEPRLTRTERSHPPRQHHLGATPHPELRLGHDEPARRLPGAAGVLAGSRVWCGDIFLPLANPAVLLSRLCGVAARRLHTGGAAHRFRGSQGVGGGVSGAESGRLDRSVTGAASRRCSGVSPAGNPSIWIGTCSCGVATTGTGRSATSATSTELSACATVAPRA